LASATPAVPRLQVAMRHRIGALSIDVNFSLTQPCTILFGPSGSGKSTILRTIAGLIQPDFARIISMPETSSAAITVIDSASGLFIPAHARRMPLALQTASLFPHMTVLQNVAYNLTNSQGIRQAEVDSLLSMFRIDRLADKLPPRLSGGESQRVNLARASAAAVAGGVLLLDEPFTGLELTLRSELIEDLKAWAAQKNLSVLSVTHDIAEAFQLDAEVIKLSEGRIVQQGPAATVLAEDRARLLQQLSLAE
jgi:molybdate transport system ATP-binding protein